MPGKHEYLTKVKLNDRIFSLVNLYASPEIQYSLCIKTWIIYTFIIYLISVSLFSYGTIYERLTNNSFVISLWGFLNDFLRFIKKKKSFRKFFSGETRTNILIFEFSAFMSLSEKYFFTLACSIKLFTPYDYLAMQERGCSWEVKDTKVK